MIDPSPEVGAELGPSPERLAAAMRTSTLPPDILFDRFYPEDIRLVSSLYWSPLAIAVRVARWMVEFELETLVDIGSGAGKLCVAGALAGPGRYIGLEHRPRLVAAARDLARVFGVEDRVCFLEGALGDSATPVADAYYLYNPFGENNYRPNGQLDADVELSHDRFKRDIARVESLLKSAPIGTCAIVYNGFGGHTPPNYRELRIHRTGSANLCIYRKSRKR